MGYLVAFGFYALALMALYYIIKRAVINAIDESNVKSDVEDLRHMMKDLLEREDESA
jgi:hypothetical protein